MSIGRPFCGKPLEARKGVFYMWVLKTHRLRRDVYQSRARVVVGFEDGSEESCCRHWLIADRVIENYLYYRYHDGSG